MGALDNTTTTTIPLLQPRPILQVTRCIASRKPSGWGAEGEEDDEEAEAVEENHATEEEKKEEEGARMGAETHHLLRKYNQNQNKTI